MTEKWNSAIVKNISVAVYVAPNLGRHVHKDRPTHGFVLNDKNAVRDYCFSDGRVMRTEGESLFYLPKGSSYSVKTLHTGGCYAINFDAAGADGEDILSEPFSLKSDSHDALKQCFKSACEEWRRRSPLSLSAAMKAVYSAIYFIVKSQPRGYLPSGKYAIIRPAVERMNEHFSDRELTVESLAALTGVSEVYFRKIFTRAFGISPKEYLVRMRMDYAKELLKLGEVEVSRIAELSGYSEPCHFSREFKRRFGVSPKDYKSVSVLPSRQGK